MVSDSIAFDRAADYYDETRGFPQGEEKGVAELVSRAGGFNSNSRVIEIGVGTGRIALPLAAHVGMLIGVDLSRPMMTRLRAKHTTEPVHLAQADATRLPFASRVFDASIAVHVFHLIPNWQGVLDELARVLRPNAPLLHCWTEPDSVFKSLWGVWKAAIPSSQSDDIGVRFERNPTFLTEVGWKLADDQHTYTYSFEVAPQKFMERLQNRIWSQTWRLTDEELAQGLAAVQAVIHSEYPSPNMPVQVTANFHVRAYTPPSV